MKWMILPLRRYAEFEGRSTRREFWLFTLGYFVVLLLIVVASVVAGSEPGGGFELPIVVWIVIAALVIPSLAVQVRRLHDQDRTGWLVLLNFIPYVGGLIVLVFMCLPGTPGANSYGPNPRDESAELEEIFR